MLESDDRVGGKSKTVFANELPHELGTCYLNFTYSRLLGLLGELGRDDAVPVASTLRRVIVDNQPNSAPALDWMLAEIMNAARDGGQDLFAEISKAAEGYQHAYTRLHDDSSYNLPATGRIGERETLSRTMSEFFEQEALTALHMMFMLYNGANGYGYADHIPVYYGSYWTSPVVLGKMVAVGAGAIPATDNERGLDSASRSSVSMLSGGFESIWHEVAARSVSDLRLNSTVTKVARPAIGASEDTRVYYWRNGIDEVIDCDFVIFAIPGAHAVRIIDDPTVDELTIFGGQISSKLVTTLIRGKNNLSGIGIAYWHSA